MKEILKDEQETDERMVIHHLADRENDQSVSSKTIKAWNLTRSKVRDILQKSAKNRKLQTTFANLIGAARFKTVKGWNVDSGIRYARAVGALTHGNTASSDMG